MKLPYAVSLGPGSSAADLTGSWRTERPVYQTLVAPCGNACPAGEDVRTWLYLAESGGTGYEAAWRTIMETNPFPAITGRVCYHPCETACNRGNLDEAVGINSVERFLGDQALEEGWEVEVAVPATGHRVLVIGSGPAGLSAAYHLARHGHEVTIRESAPAAGGMMRYGIPRYRLPREVLDAEVARVLALGVGLELDSPVTDLAAARAEGWDASSWRSAPSSAAARTCPRRPPRRSSTPSPCSTGSRRASGRCSAVGSLSTAEGTPRSTRLGPPSGSARRTPWSSTVAPASGCRPTTTR